MVLRKYSTGTITMTAATDSVTIPKVNGRLKMLSIKPSGTSTDFRISVVRMTGTIEYIFGSAAAVSVAAAGIAIAPKKLAVDTDGGALTVTANQYDDIVLANEDVVIAVSNGASDETFGVDLVVEE